MSRLDTAASCARRAVERTGAGERVRASESLGFASELACQLVAQPPAWPGADQTVRPGWGQLTVAGILRRVAECRSSGWLSNDTLGIDVPACPRSGESNRGAISGSCRRRTPPPVAPGNDLSSQEGTSSGRRSRSVRGRRRPGRHPQSGWSRRGSGRQTR
jgi:hypothetical protein